MPAAERSRPFRVRGARATRDFILPSLQPGRSLACRNRRSFISSPRATRGSGRRCSPACRSSSCGPAGVHWSDDLDPREPALAGCFPDLVWPVDIADTRGQMSPFDRILADHWRTTVIDLGQGLFDHFFKIMAEIGFEDEARQKSIQPVVLFITDAAPFTAQAYAELRRRLSRTTFVPVHNEAASFMIIAQDFPASSPKYDTIRVPRLSPIVRGVIDRPGFSFSTYMAQQPSGPTEVHSWIGQIFAEFRALELQLLIG